MRSMSALFLTVKRGPLVATNDRLALLLFALLVRQIHADEDVFEAAHVNVHGGNVVQQLSIGGGGCHRGP